MSICYFVGCVTQLGTLHFLITFDFSRLNPKIAELTFVVMLSASLLCISAFVIVFYFFFFLLEIPMAKVAAFLVVVVFLLRLLFHSLSFKTMIFPSSLLFSVMVGLESALVQLSFRIQCLLVSSCVVWRLAINLVISSSSEGL